MQCSTSTKPAVSASRGWRVGRTVMGEVIVFLILVTAAGSQVQHRQYAPPSTGVNIGYPLRTSACPVNEDLTTSIWWDGTRYKSFSEACQRSPSLNLNCHRECVAYSNCPRVYPYPLPAAHNSTFWWNQMRYSNFSEACHMSQSLRDKCHQECVIALNADLARIRMDQEVHEKQQARDMMRRMLRQRRVATMAGLSMQLTSLMVSTISMIIAIIRFILSFTSVGRIT